MKLVFQKFTFKAFSFMLLLSMGVLMVFGLRAGMEMHADGTMSGCAFMLGERAVCQMDIPEHIAAWQHLFSGIPQSFGVLALLLALGVSGLLVIQFQEENIRQRWGKYQSGAPPWKLFNPLLLAFSQGILHPKKY